MLSMENVLLQLKVVKHVQMAGNRKLPCLQPHSLGSSDFPWVVRPLPQSWSWKSRNRNTLSQADSLGQKVQVYSREIQPMLVIMYICTLLSDWGEESHNSGSLPTLKLARPLPSQALTAGHMETLNRSSSTDFLLLLYSEHSLSLAWY